MGSVTCQLPTDRTSGLQASPTDPDEFEGVITYTTRLTAKSELVDEGQLNALYGDTLIWYYSEGSYRWQYNGEGVREVLYPAEADTEYTVRAGIDTLFTLNVRAESRSLDSLYLTGDTREVLGRRCRVLIEQVGAARHAYCVDERLPIEAERFRAFEHGFLGARYAAAPGAYLAYRYESPVFVIEREAVRIESKPLGADYFAIPDLPRAPLFR